MRRNNGRDDALEREALESEERAAKSRGNPPKEKDERGGGGGVGLGAADLLSLPHRPVRLPQAGGRRHARERRVRGAPMSPLADPAPARDTGVYEGEREGQSRTVEVNHTDGCLEVVLTRHGLFDTNTDGGAVPHHAGIGIPCGTLRHLRQMAH